jgi:FkbM family methyltransferase
VTNRRHRHVPGWATAIARRLSFKFHNLVDIYDTFSPAQRFEPQVTPFGFSLSGTTSRAHREMIKGTFEPAETVIVRSLLPACDVFVDVGANIGLFTSFARTAGAHVIAIEPQPQNLRHLLTGLLHNGWKDVEVFPLAVSATPTIAALYGASGTGASLLPEWAGADRRLSSLTAVSTLDIVVGSRFVGKRFLVKIDIEGAEYPALQGASDLMERTPPPTWLIEITLDQFHPQGNPHYLETFETFFTRGYSCSLVTLEGLREVSRRDVARWAHSRRTDSDSYNYLFQHLKP